MSLNLNDKAPTTSSRYHTSTTYTQAVNDAQFVRLFGVAVLITSVVSHFLSAANLGVAVAILGFGSTSYYRAMGLVALILSFLDPILGASAMCIGIGFKGIDVLRTLATEGQGDPDWEDTNRRAVVGTVFAGVGLLINCAWVAFMVVSRILN